MNELKLQNMISQSQARAAWKQVYYAHIQSRWSCASFILTLAAVILIPLGLYLKKKGLHWTPRFRWIRRTYKPFQSEGIIRITNNSKSSTINSIKLSDPIYIACPKGEKYIQQIKENKLNNIYHKRFDTFTDIYANNAEENKFYESFCDKMNNSILTVYPNEIFSNNTLHISSNELAYAFIWGSNVYSEYCCNNNRNNNIMNMQRFILIHCYNNKSHNNYFREHNHLLLIKYINENKYIQI